MIAEAPYDWLYPLVAAPFVGSFLSVLVVRLPEREDIVVSRSRCRSCGKALSPLELVPIVSWVVQGGRCRSCGAKVSFLYPGLELAAMGVVLWAMTVVRGELLWMTSVLGWALLALLVMDWRRFILADALTLPLIPAGLAVAWRIDPDSVVWHVAGAAAGLAFMVGVAWTYRAIRGRDGLGFGDAKLMAGAGAWVGLEGLTTVLLYGPLLSLALVAGGQLAGRRVTRETPIPFGVGLAAGFWLTWLYGPLLVGG